MNKKLIVASLLTVVLAAPALALAFNAGGEPNQVSGINIPTLIDILFTIVWPIVVAFAVISFIVAAILFMSSQGDAAKVQQARGAIIWGVVGVVVALIAFSIPLIVRQTLNAGI